MKWTRPEGYGIDWEHRGTQNGTGRLLTADNSMPIPWKELSLEEFLSKMFCNPWQLTGEGMYRQVLDMPATEDDKAHKAVTFLHHQNGYTLAVLKDYRRVPIEGIPEGYTFKTEAGPCYFGKDRGTHHWAYLMRFFQVGCRHANMKEVSHQFAREQLGVSTWGMFCHVYHCPDCGYQYSVDSSG